MNDDTGNIQPHVVHHGVRWLVDDLPPPALPTVKVAARAATQNERSEVRELEVEIDGDAGLEVQGADAAPPAAVDGPPGGAGGPYDDSYVEAAWSVGRWVGRLYVAISVRRRTRKRLR